MGHITVHRRGFLYGKLGWDPLKFSKSYLAIASPTVREFTPIPSKDPPNIDNQIALEIAVYPQFVGDDLPRLYIYSTVKFININMNVGNVRITYIVKQREYLVTNCIHTVFIRSTKIIWSLLFNLNIFHRKLNV
uniref:Uncharacterized protein n=1 Tax=Oryza rufipogon TaxID=4529 RepID=A0A0E0RDA4_ORYRU